jgi:exosome complex component CSL4
VNLFGIDGKILQIPFTGILHISSSSPRYERRMAEVCKSGDVIRVKVTNTKSPTPELTTIGRGLGVIKASCSRCGGPLLLSNRRLKCRDCGNVERRKIADDYGQPSGWNL